ncbi:MAG: CCA tRNA nucleotidyltransferase [Candidatus Methylacidiphilales bacterium]|nr:CCA tRNA nucleotidyltransferase [Candidatus Methylacidiphilales bacterium]
MNAVDPHQPNPPLRSTAVQIVQKLQQAGHTAYFAGGCVRDELLGRTPKDYDIATSATPEQVQQLFDRVTDLQGKSFGVLRVMKGDHAFEVATFRHDGTYRDGRRPESVTFATPEEDARRRDFTVNGLFLDPVTGQVIDFVGGQDDLRAGLLRAIGRAEDRFQEDHLRLFRAVRFAANLDFQIDPATWQAVLHLSNLGRDLAPERVRDELIRCFTGPHPQRALDLLMESRLLDFWIPEIREMMGVEQPPQFHPEGDVYTHVRLMVGMLKDADVVLAFSVLLHDISKPETYFVDHTGRIRFNEHESRGARKAEDILRRLRFSNEQIEAICACIANHMAFKDVPHMRVSTLKRFLARPTMPVEIELHRIDCSGSHNDLEIYDLVKQKLEEFAHEPLKPDPLVNGKDLQALGMEPGREMGKILHQLMDEQLEGRFRDREAALKRAKALLQSLGIG